MNEKLTPVLSVYKRIQHEAVRNIVYAALKSVKVATLCWQNPSSSSGKFHPEDERGENGAALHTKRVAKISEDLARAFDLTPLETDFMLAASILHDVRQYNELEQETLGTLSTVIEHPEKAADLLPMYSSDVTMAELRNMIRKHSGKWGPTTVAEAWTKSIKSIDRNALLAILFHVADYIASRDYIKTEVE